MNGKRNTLSYASGPRAIAGSGSINSLAYNRFQPYPYLINTIVFNTSNSEIYENGVLKKTASVDTNPLGGFQIGRRTAVNPRYLKGDVVEVLIYNRELTAQERQNVDNYLMDKYAPSVDLGPDINVTYGFCDTVIKSQNYYETYLWSDGSTDSTIRLIKQDHTG